MKMTLIRCSIRSCFSLYYCSNSKHIQILASPKELFTNYLLLHRFICPLVSSDFKIPATRVWSDHISQLIGGDKWWPKSIGYRSCLNYLRSYCKQFDHLHLPRTFVLQFFWHIKEICLGLHILQFINNQFQ